MRGIFDINKIKKEGDTVMVGGRETDIVILVMGPTGAGKSTFLRNVLMWLDYKGALPATSDKYESCTRNLEAFVVPLPEKYATVADQRLVLVDTPGFDDTSTSDSEILRRIGVWVASSFTAKMTVGGVIYMYPIYPNRITRNDKANLKVFQKLCGTKVMTKVVMVTTKWSLCTKEVGAGRENQLRTNFWKQMIDMDAGFMRLEDSEESATKVVEEVFKRYGVSKAWLDIQAEIVDEIRRIPRTEAGRELKSKLEELLKEHKAASGNLESRRERLQKLSGQLKELKIPFSARIREFFGMLLQ